MEVSLALVTFCLKFKNIFLSAFPGKIVIGKVVHNHFLENSLEFYLRDLSQLYFSIINIFKNLEKDSVKEIILKKSKTYFWHIHQSTITIGAETTNVVFEVTFLTIEEFSEFVDVLQKCILPCLCLPIAQRNILDTMANLPTEDIVLFKERENLVNFIKTNVDLTEIQRKDAEEIVFYYFEEIIIIQKLRSMKNPSLDINKINTILDCN